MILLSYVSAPFGGGIGHIKTILDFLFLNLRIIYHHWLLLVPPSGQELGHKFRAYLILVAPRQLSLTPPCVLLASLVVTFSIVTPTASHT